VARLLAAYTAAQQEVDRLTKANEHQRAELIRTHSELSEMTEKYRRLMTAHAMLSDSPDRDKARRQITQLINRVDKTLALIKE